MTRLLTAILTITLLAGCTGQQGKYVRWINRHLTYEDKAAYKPEFWEQNVAKALEVRDRMGWDIPEDIFKHFVLPTQVVERPMDNFRLVYADSLCQRVQGMTMWEAAREINYWCLERAIYGHDTGLYIKDTPMGTVERGLGACDELTNLYVSALRAAGIPARAAAVTWLHANSSHKWTEIWVDGKWHFECSVEPWEDLDASWLCNGAPKSMLTCVKVFGPYKGPEPVLSRDRHWTIVDNGARYQPRRLTTVTVVDARKRRVKGATVEFKIFNSGNLTTIHSAKTDRKGQVSLETGLGSMVVWASKDGMYGFCKADRENVGLAMTHNLADGGSAEFSIESPPRVLLPYNKPEDLVKKMDKRNHWTDTVRAERHILPPSDSLIAQYRTEVQRPHLPGKRLRINGRAILKISSDADLNFGDNLGILRILQDGSTEPTLNLGLEPGSYLVTCGQRIIARSEYVKSTIVNIPVGAANVSIDLSIPIVPDADLKCLHSMADTIGVRLIESPWRVISLIDDTDESSIMAEWVKDVEDGKFRILETSDTVSANLKSIDTMKGVAETLKLNTPCVVMTDRDGNVWFATDKWDNNTEYEMTAVRNALEKR